MLRICLTMFLIFGARFFSTMRKSSRNSLVFWSVLRKDSPDKKSSQLPKSTHKNSSSSSLFSEPSLWTLRTSGWSRMTVSRNPFSKSTNSANSKSTKRSLNHSRKHPTVSENSKKKPSNFTQLATTSSSRKSSQTLRTSCYCSTHTPSMICVDTGKNLKKNPLIQSLSTIRQLKDLRCTTIQTQTICSESSHKFHDSWKSLLILKLITLLNSGIQRSLVTWLNCKTLVFWESWRISSYANVKKIEQRKITE